MNAPVPAPMLEAYPNPFTETLGFNISLTHENDLSLTITTPDGRLIDQVQQGMYGAGSHDFNWTPTRLPAGVYYLTL